jgi:hypothetical protein
MSASTHCSVPQPTVSPGGAAHPCAPSFTDSALHVQGQWRWSNSLSGFEVLLPNSGNDMVNFTELAAALKVPQRYLAVNFRTQQFTILSRMDGDHLPGNFPFRSDLWDKHCFVCDDIPTPSKLFVADSVTACVECMDSDEPAPPIGLCVECVDTDANLCFLCYSTKSGWKPTTTRNKLLNDVWGAKPHTRQNPRRFIEAHPLLRGPEVTWHLCTCGDFTSEETTQTNDPYRFFVLRRL